LLSSLESTSLANPGVRHEGSCHMMPVKLRSCRGLRSHLRHAAPVRSRARKPAFMAPVLAFGPRRWAAGSLSPSSLFGVLEFWVLMKGVGGGGGIGDLQLGLFLGTWSSARFGVCWVVWSLVAWFGTRDALPTRCVAWGCPRSGCGVGIVRAVVGG
jgi:hypothetical protein